MIPNHDHQFFKPLYEREDLEAKQEYIEQLMDDNGCSYVKTLEMFDNEELSAGIEREEVES